MNLQLIQLSLDSTYHHIQSFSSSA